MEGLIAVMRGRRGAPTVDVPAAQQPTVSVRAGQDELAAVAWRAMQVSLVSNSGEDEGCADDEPAYLERGAVVGRYVVLRKLGAGGMGVVYAAYDPELDRKLALKLVLPGKADGEGRTRLLREAQALAKLSHRNVVAIHDVGTMGGQVWLAMEFVRGQTLRQWLRTPRRWQEVVGVLRKAGRGLAAAHAAGLLHRDFKPDNVMVGAHGGVRVMDFGLARARANVVSLGAEESTIEAVPVLDTLAMRVTQAGTLLGTPVYMAPEQLLGRELGPAADQYALCVTLWEALYGERPFAGETLDELVDAVIAGRVREPASGRGVPGWLRRVCEQGLCVQPQQRFASMAALLDALASGQARARVRRGLAAVGVMAVLGLGGEGYRRWEEAKRVEACEASGSEVDAAWNAERKQALHDALVATGVSYAPTTAEKVMPWLDQQAQAWSEARVETCLDAKVRGRWGGERLDRSLWCLDERRMELESLVDELLVADPEVVQKAVPAVAGLASVEPCRDERMLEALGLPSSADREAIRAVRAEVTRAGNLERAGRYDKGLERARGALARAEVLGWQPLTAAARFRLGSLLAATGAYAQAETSLEDAYFEAADGVAPETSFDAARELVFVVGYHASRPVEARRWGRHATVALAAIPDGEHLGSAQLLNNLVPVSDASGEYEEAKALQAQALVILERALGLEHPDITGSLNNLANIYETSGDYDQARALHERALTIIESALGPEHPYAADSLNNLAGIHQQTGDYEGARALYHRALAIREHALGPEHPDVARSLSNLGENSRITGEYEQAKVFLTRALAIVEETLDPAHPDGASILTNLANVHSVTGEYEQAQLQYERALAITEKALGPEHVLVAQGLHNLALAHRALGAYEQATAAEERALAIIDKALGTEHPAAAYPLVGLALVALERHRPADALMLARRATAVRENGGVAPDLLADAQFVLARALWDVPAEDGRDRTQAVSLAEQARDAYHDTGEGRAKDLAEVAQWLAAHRVP
jgi:eukaryotic-like serine/threonine-protein kinase